MGQVCSVKGFVTGRVQGVGFRYFVMRHAQARNLSGYVRNLDDGRVEFFLHGDVNSVATVTENIRVGPPHAKVDDLEFEETNQAPFTSEFIVR
jgi:acylphosphatase